MRPLRQHSKFPQLDRQLAVRGLRPTVQRRQVYAVLVQDLDHPTAQEVFLRAKSRVADISLATVYNCLDALVACGLVRRVQGDPAANRFCANMREHGHFFCERCGVVSDLEIDSQRITGTALLPRGYSAQHYEVCVRGICADCANRRTAAKPSSRAMA